MTSSSTYDNNEPNQTRQKPGASDLTSTMEEIEIPVLDQRMQCVDPFIGSETCDLPAPEGIASKWFWPKPQIGNTHPGACLPLGMVSACAFSGGYPTGYGRWDKCTEGAPPALFEEKVASGFTHFHPSGVGAIRKYYNYARITPVTQEMGGFLALGETWPLKDEIASPGYYACTLGDSGIRVELTVTDRGAIHRITFPKSNESSILLDFSHGGIGIKDGATLPLRASCYLNDAKSAHADVTLEGLNLSMSTEVKGFERMYSSYIWSGNDILEDDMELSFNNIRPSAFEPFGVAFRGPTYEGQTVELNIGFSWKSPIKAGLHIPGGGFDHVRKKAIESWSDTLDKIQVEGGTEAERRVFYTSFYRSFIKPCDATNESPFWPWDSPFYFDMSTMWDMYKTQLPLMLSLMPQRGVDFINTLLNIYEMEGNFPIGYRMARGYDRFANQASSLAHVTIADALHRGLKGIDWERAAILMRHDLYRHAIGEKFVNEGFVHPVTHTLDLAYGCYCTSLIAEHIGDEELLEEMQELSGNWVNAYARETGLLRDSTFYEGGRWNYSFRLLHDMQKRMELSGGAVGFAHQLDQFFGYEREDAVEQVGVCPTRKEMKSGYDLHSFEGLNNEPDMEVPYAYAYAGRHDRVCEIVRAGMKYMYADTPGGMCGNDDSGGMTSWYVWSAIGLFPVAGQNKFILGSPLFSKIQLKLPGGDLKITVLNSGDENIYVKNARLNGFSLDEPFLTWQDLVGGQLHLEMTSEPTLW